MEWILTLVNALACGLISLALLAAIVSPAVQDGVIIKVGLISMALGFGAMALRLFDGIGPEEMPSVLRALALINAGIGVVIVGYLLRKAVAKHPVRRSTDWGELDTRPAGGGDA